MADCCGDEALMRTMAQEFLENKDQLLDDIHQALHDEDAEGLRRSAHALNDATKLFGGTGLAELCHHLEQMGEDETFTGADETLVELSGAIHGIRKALEIELHGF